MMLKDLVKIGNVVNYLSRKEVAVVELVDKLKIGDIIRVKGATTDFSQKVESIQIYGVKVEEAGAGDSVGILVDYRVRKGDEIFIT